MRQQTSNNQRLVLCYRHYRVCQIQDFYWKRFRIFTEKKIKRNKTYLANALSPVWQDAFRKLNIPTINTGRSVRHVKFVTIFYDKNILKSVYKKEQIQWMWCELSFVIVYLHGKDFQWTEAGICVDPKKGNFFTPTYIWIKNLFSITGGFLLKLQHRNHHSSDFQRS